MKTTHIEANYGAYPLKVIAFDGEDELCAVVEPHVYEMRFNKDYVSRFSFPGCTVKATPAGAVCFFDSNGELSAACDGVADMHAPMVRLCVKRTEVTVEFGCTREVDTYPHCDGEYDRYVTRFCAERGVVWKLSEHTVTIRKDDEE